MSVEYIVFISEPTKCPHCDHFRQLYDQLSTVDKARFDVRTGNTNQTNPPVGPFGKRYEIPHWPIVFWARPINPATGELNMNALSESPNVMVQTLLDKQRMLGGNYRTSRDGRAGVGSGGHRAAHRAGPGSAYSYRADTINRASPADSGSALKSLAIVAIAAWVLMF